MTYTKLFKEIIHSTIWREPNHVRLVWITMLALRDQFNTVQASVPGLADVSRVTLHECQEALKILSGPDPFSRSQEYEGRRIEDCEGGWLILNGARYRDKMNPDDRRRYKTEKQREYRARGQSVDKSGLSGHSRVEQSIDIVKKERRTFVRPSRQQIHEYMLTLSTSADEESHKFYDFYQSNGWKVGRNAMKDWQATARNWIKRNGERKSGGPSATDLATDRNW